MTKIEEEREKQLSETFVGFAANLKKETLQVNQETGDKRELLMAEHKLNLRRLEMK